MWIAQLVAASLAVAQHAPDTYVRVGCPWMPVYFRDGTTELDAGGRGYAIPLTLLWIRELAQGGGFTVILETGTVEDRSLDLVRLSAARAEAVRNALIASGVAAGRIFIAHGFRDGPSMAPEGWIGGWVYPEVYMPQAVIERAMPPGGPIC